LTSVASCGSISEGVTPGGSFAARLGGFLFELFHRPAMD